MLLQKLLIPGVLVPVAIAAMAFVVAQWAGKRAGKPVAGGGLAVAAAYLAASVALTGWPHWPPVAAIQRLFFLVIVAMIAVWILGRLGRSQSPWVVRGLLSAATLGLTLQSQIKNRWSVSEAALWLIGLLIGARALGWAFERNLAAPETAPSGRSAGWLSAAVRLALVGSTALMLGLSESAQLAQLGGALASGMAAVEIVALLGRSTPWRGIDALVPVTVLTGLLAIGYFYAGLGTWPGVLLVLSFVLLAPANQHGTGRILLPLVPLVIALGLVIVTFLNQEDDPYGDYSQQEVRASQVILV